MAFLVGKRVVAESESTSPPTPQRRRCASVARRPLAPVSHPLGRRPREHLHARERSPASRTTPEKATTTDAAQTLNKTQAIRADRGGVLRLTIGVTCAGGPRRM